MTGSMERAGGAQNKETRPQAKNKLDSRFVGPYFSTPGLSLACPLESVHLSSATTDGEMANWDFFTSLSPSFPSPNSFSAS